MTRLINDGTIPSRDWSLKRGCDADSTASAFGNLATDIRDFIRNVRARQATGAGSQWSAIDDFSNRIPPEAVNLISQTFLDPDIVKWFVQEESHIRDPENYLVYLENNAERLTQLQARLSTPPLAIVSAQGASSPDRSKRGSTKSVLVGQPVQSLSVFISHSSQDAALAGQLVDLLRSALNLRADRVRCTSVDGYGLPAGADSDEQLRDEALDSLVFIGILSPLSMASAYVLFELGARWGAKKPIVPLLAPGMGPQALRGPLVGLNAISCDSAAQLHQLVTDVSRTLGVEAEGAAVYQRHVDAIIYSAHPTQTVDTSTPPSSPSTPHVAVTSTARATTAELFQTDEYGDAEEVIARHCEREWPDDFNMLAYCIEQQREAVATLKAGAPDDIPAATFLQIRRRCAREWPDDYNMRHYCEQQQITGYRQVQKSRR
jgi:hypothetical protein